MVATKRDKQSGESLGTGRRKSAVARVRLKAGTGKIVINDLPMDQFFCVDGDRRAVVEALDVTGHMGDVDLFIRVSGGGTTGQSVLARWASRVLFAILTLLLSLPCVAVDS